MFNCDKEANLLKLYNAHYLPQHQLHKYTHPLQIVTIKCEQQPLVCDVNNFRSTPDNHTAVRYNLQTPRSD